MLIIFIKVTPLSYKSEKEREISIYNADSIQEAPFNHHYSFESYHTNWNEKIKNWKSFCRAAKTTAAAAEETSSIFLFTRLIIIFFYSNAFPKYKKKSMISYQYYEAGGARRRRTTLQSITISMFLYIATMPFWLALLLYFYYSVILPSWEHFRWLLIITCRLEIWYEVQLEFEQRGRVDDEIRIFNLQV